MSLRPWFGFLLPTPGLLAAQNPTKPVDTRTVSAGTSIEVCLTRHVPMKVGTALRATLDCPVYIDDVLTLPALLH
jgi:hypothetical protein